jgi:hypothetical protein
MNDTTVLDLEEILFTTTVRRLLFDYAASNAKAVRKAEGSIPSLHSWRY